MMKVIVCKNKQEIGAQAYQIVRDQLKANPQSVLGLATGSSPIELYQEMIKGYKNGEISFEEVKTFNLDEYVGIDRKHPQSYYNFMHEHLFDAIDLNPINIHIPCGDSQQDCENYDQLLQQNPIDIQILGIGSNGHIGFNEPGTSFKSTTHIAQLKTSTIKDNARFFDGDINKVPTQAISMGIANIMAAKKIILLASGTKKIAAIKQLLTQDVNVDCPATILQEHPDVTVFIDETIAKSISE